MSVCGALLEPAGRQDDKHIRPGIMRSGIYPRSSMKPPFLALEDRYLEEAFMNLSASSPHTTAVADALRALGQL